jgi:hypothetical protein
MIHNTLWIQHEYICSKFQYAKDLYLVNCLCGNMYHLHSGGSQFESTWLSQFILHDNLFCPGQQDFPKFFHHQLQFDTCNHSQPSVHNYKQLIKYNLTKQAMYV